MSKPLKPHPRTKQMLNELAPLLVGHDWPWCPVKGCRNRTCLALDSDKCFVHTPGFAFVKRARIRFRHWLADLKRGM